VGRLTSYFAVRVEPAEGAVSQVTVSGEVDPATSDVLFDVLVRALSAARTTHVEVDLAEVTLLDASGIGVLLAARNRAHTAGKTLSVCAATGMPLRVLEVTGLLGSLHGKTAGEAPSERDGRHRRRRRLKA
jgi:anti-sigma B factor antagonist